MLRTLTTPTGNAVAGPSTAPAYLIQIGWSTVVRLTTGAAVTWGGYDWVSESATLTGLSWNREGLQAATLKLNNSDQRYSALALSAGVTKVLVTIYAYDQSATATNDPVLVFSGERGKINLVDDSVTLSLRAQSQSLTSPRTRVSPANGFNHLPPRGTTIMWGSQRYVLEGR